MGEITLCKSYCCFGIHVRSKVLQQQDQARISCKTDDTTLSLQLPVNRMIRAIDISMAAKARDGWKSTHRGYIRVVPLQVGPLAFRIPQKFEVQFASSTDAWTSDLSANIQLLNYLVTNCARQLLQC